MQLFRHPVLCNYYLTYRCNAKCGFCDIWEKPSPYVNRKNFAANLRDLKKLKVRVVDFTGGEPLLHRDLPEFLKMAKEMGFVTTVTTNTLLYPKQAEQLAGLIDMLHFSLDSVDEQKHNESRGVNCFGHFVESLEIAKRLGEKPDILFTVTNENFAEIEAVYRKFAQPNGAMLILNPVFGYNEVGEDLKKEVLAELKAWSYRKGVYLNRAFLELRESGGNRIEDPICKAGSSTVVISPENELVLPCYHLGSKSLKIDDNLAEVYESAEAQKWRNLEGRLPECEGCVINCYMEPSFAVNLNRLFFSSLRSTLKYSLEKWVYS